MVRRSSRLRSRLNETKEEKRPDSDEKEETDDIESLVQTVYAVIKQKVEEKKEYNSSKTIILNPKETNKSSYPKVAECQTLASELKPQINSNDLYFKMDKKNSQSMVSGIQNKSKFDDKEIMKRSVITSDFEKQERAPVHLSYSALKKQKKIEKEKTTGSQWFNMPAPEMTPELKRDLNILKMRTVLDPKRHYKKNNSKKLPKYFQIGTVVSDPAEFYSSRLPKSQRQKTIVESLLSDAEFRRYNKRKFLEIQATKQAAGRKGFYKRKKKRR